MDCKKRLEKNDRGYWEIRWTERDGKGAARSRAISTRQTDRNLAAAVAREFERAEAETAARKAGTSVGALLDGYAAAAKARGVGPTQFFAIRHLRGYFGAFGVDELTPAAVLDYRKARGVQDATLRRELNTLVAALAWAVKHRIIPVAPAIDLPPPGLPKAEFLERDAEDDLFRLAKADAGRDGRLTRTGRFICIGLATGARKAAIEGLTWDRVDLRLRVIDFRDPKARATKKRRVKTPIPDRLFPVLERASRERRPGDAHVLDDDGNVRAGFEAFMGRHGFAKVTPHVLRHTRITLLLQAGVSVWDVAALVGASPDMIQEVYGHWVADDRLHAQANRTVAG